MSELTVEERVTALERQNRRLKLGMLVVLAAIGGLVLLGMERPQKVIEAEKFVLKDAAGNTRAALELLREGPALALMNAKGNERAILALHGAAPELTFVSDRHDGAGAELRLVSGGAALILRGTPGNRRDLQARSIAIGSNSDGSHLSLFEFPNNGKAFGCTNITEGVITLFDRQDHVRVQLGAGDESGLSLCDERHRPRVDICVKRSGPRIILNDENMKPIFRAP